MTKLSFEIEWLLSYERGASCFGAGRRLRVAVFLQVSVEVCLLAEAAVAKAALERSLLVVDVAYMSLQVARNAEGTRAEAAFIGLLAGVGSQVAG